MTTKTDCCVHCGTNSMSAPLLAFQYRGRGYHICSQHLPVLIHDPTRLVGQLPGAEGLTPAEHKD